MLRILVALVPLLSAAPVQKPQEDCRADTEKFCKGLEKKALNDCLYQHAAELSWDCRTLVHKAKWDADKARIEKERGVCVEETKKFCPDVKKEDPEKLQACLRMHMDKLSKRCQKFARSKGPWHKASPVRAGGPAKKTVPPNPKNPATSP